MGNYFDEDDDVVDEIASEYEAEQENAEELSEVEKRLELAHHYRMLLKQKLFADRTEASQTVEKEVRNFIVLRLEELMGVRMAKGSVGSANAQFSDEQAKALIQLANKILGNAQTKEPTINPVPPEKPVQSKPVPRMAFQPIQQQQAPRPQPKAQRQAPAPQPQQKPQKKTKASAHTGVTIPEEHKNDPTLEIKNGRIYVQSRDKDGNPIEREGADGFWEPVMKDVTPQVVPPGYKPIVPNLQQSMILAANKSPRAKKTEDSEGGFDISSVMHHHTK